MLSAEDKVLLNNLFVSIRRANSNCLGYPFARGFEYDQLGKFTQLPAINMGDPFECGNYRVNSKIFERDVVDFFASLFNAEAGSYWGYVTCGGAEGNLSGLYLAREMFPTAVTYFTRETRGNIRNATRLLGLRHVEIRAMKHGEMDYDDLKLQAMARKRHDAIVVANIGTAMKEARDDIVKIRSTLEESGIRNIYIHCDASLSGPYATFIKPRPNFDFSHGADSIAISGHEFFGSPVPSGVLLTRKSHVEHLTVDGANPQGRASAIIVDSRSAYAILVLWYAIRSLGKDGIRKRMEVCGDIASQATHLMNTLGIPAWKNPGAITVVFPAVSASLEKKWQIMTADVSQIIVTPGTSIFQIESMARELIVERRRECGLSMNSEYNK
ncbi:histidine decarboxylase [Burkholderia ubonensis]|uniref:histidine decarboxylase n=1 Tax=Burkholderia ubonensis TaxID=101571 RepID=UPI000A67E332|nr:histidine decarboxylase [Burkholderia ubonensis]